MKTSQENNTIYDKYYCSITELPLRNYINCLIDKGLSYLIISGEPALGDLAIAWNNIEQEYSDAIGNESYDLYLRLAKEIALLEINLTLVENCVSILRCVYVKKYSDKVNEILRTNFLFDYTSQDNYQEMLDLCLVRSKSISINIQIKKAQLEGQEKKFKSDSKAPTREYFESILITLSDHSKYQIRDDITVYQFVERIRRLNLYCCQLEKENNKK